MIVKLKKNQSGKYEDLTEGQNYTVIGIEADDFRLLNDHGSPYLYPPGIFEITDPHEPSGWISETGEDGERYAYPPQFNSPGFFEDYFDNSAGAVRTFWQLVNQQLAIAAETA